MKKTRKILKDYFRAKSIPSSEQFADLIDSIPNILEDRCIRNGENGVMLYPSGDDNTILEIYSENIDKPGVKKSYWSIVMDENKNLRLLNVDGAVVFSTEVKNEEVKDKTLKIQANREWKYLPVESKGTITKKSGCRGYRIFAYYKRPNLKKHAFVEVVASHQCGKKLKISSSSKFWGIWFCRIRFRWILNEEGISLEMRSRKVYPNVDIHIRIFELYEFIDK